MNINRAARIISDLGNVCSDAIKLVDDKPTQDQLNDAANQARLTLNRAIEALREHHELGPTDHPFPPDKDEIKVAINDLVMHIHNLNGTWWRDPSTGAPVKRNVGEMLMLVVSEIAEAMEGDRKDLKDDKLPHRSMMEVELADAVIRIFDIAGGLGFDLGGALSEKLEYNRTRLDHKPENRLKEGGKKY